MLSNYRVVDAFSSASSSSSPSPSAETSISSSSMINNRVFIGGLSPTCTEQQLRSTFNEQFGLVNDVIIIKGAPWSKEGFVPYGFVTFEDETCAQKAVNCKSSPPTLSANNDGSNNSDSAAAMMPLYKEIQLAKPLAARKRSNASRTKEAEALEKVKLFSKDTC